MSKAVRFTKHAEQKFGDLAEIGFVVTKEQVIDTVTNPESVDQTVHPPIAQKIVSKNHLLRVVFVEDSEWILVITFYPARRSRYEV
jgi:hypothetical protein